MDTKASVELMESIFENELVCAQYLVLFHILKIK